MRTRRQRGGGGGQGQGQGVSRLARRLQSRVLRRRYRPRREDARGRQDAGCRVLIYRVCADWTGAGCLLTGLASALFCSALWMRGIHTCIHNTTPLIHSHSLTHSVMSIHTSSQLYPSLPPPCAPKKKEKKPGRALEHVKTRQDIHGCTICTQPGSRFDGGLTSTSTSASASASPAG